ncbi:MAG: peroxiredoxin-like family protein [Hyphomicrobiaceae bacterium]
MTSLGAIFEEARRLDGPLADRLTYYAQGLGRDAPGLASAYATFIDRLRVAEAGTDAPMPGDALPPFLLPDQSGSLVASPDLLQSGPLVISFNRGHWCSFCRLEVLALAQLSERLAGLRTRLVSITPERAIYAQALREQTGFSWPVLTDIDLAYAMSLGLAVPVGDALGVVLRAADVDLSVYHGSNAWFLPIPATFVVAQDGRILARHVDPDFRHRMEPEAILAVLADVRA